MTTKNKKNIELSLKIEKNGLAFSEQGLAARLKRLGYTAETRNSLDKKVVAAADKLIAKHTKNIEAYKAKIAKLEAELTKAEAVEVKTAA